MMESRTKTGEKNGKSPIKPTNCLLLLQSILVRSSQPMPGPNAKRSKSDEKLLNAYLKSSKKGIIIDTRTQTLAQTAKVNQIRFVLLIAIINS